jgi:NAD(P)-dependent dehydrogenase (short-subunit alcohol dehydrogenase family)
MRKSVWRRGANSGIGKVTTKALAAGGATVIMACRNRDKGEAARDEIVREARNENVSLVIADFSDLSQIRRLAAGVKAKYPRLHALAPNAGSYNGVQSGCNVICRLGCAPALAKRK